MALGSVRCCPMHHTFLLGSEARLKFDSNLQLDFNTGHTSKPLLCGCWSQEFVRRILESGIW